MVQKPLSQPQTAPSWYKGPRTESHSSQVSAPSQGACLGAGPVDGPATDLQPSQRPGPSVAPTAQVPGHRAISVPMSQGTGTRMTRGGGDGLCQETRSELMVEGRARGRRSRQGPQVGAELQAAGGKWRQRLGRNFLLRNAHPRCGGGAPGWIKQRSPEGMRPRRMSAVTL